MAEPDAPVDFVVAGFEPFGGRLENRSWQVVQALPALPADVTCERAQLPVDFAALRTLVPALVARARHAVLLLGEAGTIDALQVERVALNVADARIPDNRGAQPRLEAIDAAGMRRPWRARSPRRDSRCASRTTRAPTRAMRRSTWRSPRPRPARPLPRSSASSTSRSTQRSKPRELQRESRDFS